MIDYQQYKYFWLNESKLEEISEIKFEELVQENCKKYIESGLKFYRGIKNTNNYLISTAEKRTSVGITDVWNQFFDNNYYYQKRSNSIFFNKSKTEAKKYGTLYEVYPFDDNVISCTRIQFQYAYHSRFINYFDIKYGREFKNQNLRLDSFFYNLSQCLNTDCVKLYTGATTYDDAKKWMKYFDLHKDELITNVESYNFYESEEAQGILKMLDEYKKSKSFEDFLKKILDPERAIMFNVKISKETMGAFKACEDFWTEGTCLLKKIAK